MCATCVFRFFDKYDPVEYRERIGNKALAERYYGKYLKREQFRYSDGHEAFLKFAEEHPRIFIKKAVGWGGDGARIESVDTIEKAESVWNSLSEDFVAEPVIENHPEIKAINPDCLNTLRFITLGLADGPKIQMASIRFGNRTIVDNVHSGGMVAGIDLESGIIDTAAKDRHFRKYTNHPVTGMPITGARIPCFREAAELALKAASVTPELRYCSWDIAVTPDGPIMIEGNWDAEFYIEQALFDRGHRQLYIDLLEGRA